MCIENPLIRALPYFIVGIIFAVLSSITHGTVKIKKLHKDHKFHLLRGIFLFISLLLIFKAIVELFIRYKC